MKLKIKYLLNGHDRFSTRDGNYFSVVQPFQHHTRIPHGPAGNGINVYSFDLSREMSQPSATSNVAGTDNALKSIIAPTICNI